MAKMNIMAQNSAKPYEVFNFKQLVSAQFEEGVYRRFALYVVRLPLKEM